METEPLPIPNNPSPSRRVTFIRGRAGWRLDTVVVFRGTGIDCRSVIYRRGPKEDPIGVVVDYNNKVIGIKIIRDGVYQTATYEYHGRTVASLVFTRGKSRWQPKIWFDA